MGDTEKNIFFSKCHGGGCADPWGVGGGLACLFGEMGCSLCQPSGYTFSIQNEGGVIIRVFERCLGLCWCSDGSSVTANQCVVVRSECGTRLWLLGSRVCAHIDTWMFMRGFVFM